MCWLHVARPSPSPASPASVLADAPTASRVPATTSTARTASTSVAAHCMHLARLLHQRAQPIAGSAAGCSTTACCAVCVYRAAFGPVPEQPQQWKLGHMRMYKYTPRAQYFCRCWVERAVVAVASVFGSTQLTGGLVAFIHLYRTCESARAPAELKCSACCALQSHTRCFQNQPRHIFICHMSGP